MTRIAFAVVLVASAFFAGCDNKSESPTAPTAPTTSPAKSTAPADDDVAKERAKLSATDLAHVEAQEWCVISSEERLGAMGAPIKLDIEGQPVFVCCKGCQAKALREADATLAKVADLKAKKLNEKQ